MTAHLSAVATRTAEFAASLGPSAAAAWGETLGRWHDLGKYSDDFQRMLRQANGLDAHLEGTPGRVDHSTAGAQHAAASFDRFGRLLAYAIAGHHSGLADAEVLDSRLAKDIPAWREHADPATIAAPLLGLPDLSVQHGCGRRLAFQSAFFVRMLFSCLIDADRLETERFCDPDLADQRNPPPTIAALSGTLTDHLDGLASRADNSTPVNARRREVLEACRSAATLPPGLFSLTVPTGGGKTLASLEFALRHAKQHGMRRAIVAIPFTSIIEQTAQVYRRVFERHGDQAVLEHHSNLDPTKETWRNRLAVENWDASLVVTTNVQLFETLFASRTTACRKLHRIAGSVIVLDEAQTLPVGLLRPCLAAIRELVADYGCSVVLCTATQPALERRANFDIGLEGVREIIPDPERLHSGMRRVASSNLGVLDNDALAAKLSASACWLTIVNTRPHAAELYRRLATGSPPDGLFHLSTRLCGQHRSDKLSEIKQRLEEGRPCQVVSTQLVEAGVDLDFPEVFRALAGVDSIAQAAGRCNREGRLPALGRLHLFDPADVQPKGYLGATAATTREVLEDFPDLLDPQAVEQYFHIHYWSRAGDNNWDDPRVMDCFPPELGDFYYDFSTACDRFRLIDDQTEPVFIPYGRGAALVDRLRAGDGDRILLRKLQRFTVGLAPWERQRLIASGDVELLESGLLVLANASLYDNNLGLLVDRPGHLDADKSVV